MRAGRREPVYVVEGEKDVEALRGLGLTATTSPMGAGKWKDEHTKTLVGARRVVVVADRDESGREHAQTVYAALAGEVDEVELVEPPADLGEHADVSDLLAAGRALGELEPLPPESPERETSGEGRPHSWRPLDLRAIAADPPAPPSIGGLVYAGRRHVLFGEPESLKTWAAAVLAVEEVEAERTVLYVDAENGPAVMLERFRSLGLSEEQLGRILYVEPSEPIGDPAILADVAELLAEREPSLAVLDSFDALLALHGLDPNSTVDVERFYRSVVDPLRAHGAAVVMLDHVTKDRERRGRFSIGSQRKTGAAEVALGLEIVRPFARGRSGLVRIVTNKDRPGHLSRPRAAELQLDSDAETGRVTWTLRPPAKAEGEDGFRPTRLMEKVSRFVEAYVAEEKLSRGAVEDGVTGKRDYVRQAIDLLAAEGYLEETAGPHSARLLRSLRPYREDVSNGD